MVSVFISNIIPPSELFYRRHPSIVNIPASSTYISFYFHTAMSDSDLIELIEGARPAPPPPPPAPRRFPRCCSCKWSFKKIGISGFVAVCIAVLGWLHVLYGWLPRLLYSQIHEEERYPDHTPLSYQLQDTYSGADFFDAFDFLPGYGPMTHGIVSLTFSPQPPLSLLKSSSGQVRSSRDGNV